MAARLFFERAGLLAGVAQVAATAAAQVATEHSPSRPVPVMQIHGTSDPFWPYATGASPDIRRRIVFPGQLDPALTVDAWASALRTANATSGEAVETELAADITVRAWHGPTPASDVVFVRVGGAGHTWPGARFSLPSILFGRTSRTFDATRLICEFFAAHTDGGAASAPSRYPDVD